MRIKINCWSIRSPMSHEKEIVEDITGITTVVPVQTNATSNTFKMPEFLKFLCFEETGKAYNPTSRANTKQMNHTA